MPHRLLLNKGNELINITPVVDNFSWSSNMDELGTELDFDIIHSDARYVPENQVELGDMIILEGADGAEITRTIVVDESINGRQPISYSSFDLSWYLNKNEAVYQFNSTSATSAIQRICSDYNIPVLEIAQMATQINKIYSSENLAAIIEDILEQVQNETGTKYIHEMRFGEFFVYAAVDMVIEPKFQLAENLTTRDIKDMVASPTRNRSIDDLKNRVQIVHNDSQITQLTDQPSVDEYGLLSHIEDIQDEDVSRARQIARNKLDELSKVSEENSIETMGNDQVLAGRMIDIEEPITGMTGRYMITSVQHTVSNGIHRMNLDLEGVS
ncbi:XkdQ/YqbQ family protein [Salsuginibacillus kocurii]|uniref:XkdQ/YqbQ family protein n=1 Tax=Salsuginibacillus kocurii TaxID=427078 RepID=UPI0003A7631A|nr:hypothetical protein [Salsuginibacillus kocurii]